MSRAAAASIGTCSRVADTPTMPLRHSCSCAAAAASLATSLSPPACNRVTRITHSSDHPSVLHSVSGSGFGSSGSANTSEGDRPALLSGDRNSSPAPAGALCAPLFGERAAASSALAKPSS